MAITKQQAMTENYFHVEGGRTRSDGSCRTWRRNGQTQTWKTRPDEFRIPVKYGLKAYDNITHQDAPFVHLERECPHVTTRSV